MAQITGYSVPPSEADVTPLYTSGSSSATAKAAPTKKFKPTPAVPALVATFSNVEMHNANQTQGSSESEISVVSSAERHNRLLLARAKRELAEARVHEAQAELDFVTSSRAGSVGRLTDVRSEGGSSVRAPRRTDAAASLTQLDEVAEEPPTTTTTRNVTDGYSDGARAPARGTPPSDCDADTDACTGDCRPRRRDATTRCLRSRKRGLTISWSGLRKEDDIRRSCSRKRDDVSLCWSPNRELGSLVCPRKRDTRTLSNSRC